MAYEQDAGIDYSKLICPLSMAAPQPSYCQTTACGTWVQKPSKRGGQIRVCVIITFFNRVGLHIGNIGEYFNDLNWAKKKKDGDRPRRREPEDDQKRGEEEADYL